MTLLATSKTQQLTSVQNLGEETPVYLGLHEDAYFVLEP